VTKAKEKFKLHWCKPNGGVSINAHDKIITRKLVSDGLGRG
jgi:hypothetical protein